MEPEAAAAELRRAVSAAGPAAGAGPAGPAAAGARLACLPDPVEAAVAVDLANRGCHYQSCGVLFFGGRFIITTYLENPAAAVEEELASPRHW